MKLLASLITLSFFAVAHAQPVPASSAPSAGSDIASKDATAATLRANDQIRSQLNFSDRRDFDDARRGFIATLPQPVLKGSGGRTVVDLTKYDFLRNTDAAPPTVNPSLWRQEQILAIHGLFKVVDGIYQVRNIDLANITFVRGKTGWIVVDTGSSEESAKAALDLINDKVERLPVSAVIITHSHVDHFSGLRGVVSEQDVRSGKVKLIAPDGFMEEAVSENVFAGNAMSRRASYMYGDLLPKSPRGTVGSGLGLVNATGTLTLLQPNTLVHKTGEKLTVDGIDVVFQMAPGTEAPAEMLFYFPQYKTLDVAEDATHSLHNLLTLRGAKVRDAGKWAEALDQTIDMFGGDVAVSMASHHWPQWGNDRVVEHLKKQRDLYKYINDQTLRMANEGLTMHEIAEQFVLPDALAKEFYNRGYYGNLKHDVRATYQMYLGWWDANPANLDPLPPAEEAKRYVDLIGADNIMANARKAFEQGDYRWVATITSKLVFAQPENQAARQLEADALEQLGYQTESGPVRNVYLTGAEELRNGIRKMAAPNTAAPDIIAAMTTDMFLDFLAIHLNGPRAADVHYTFNLVLPDANERYAVTVENGVMIHSKGKTLPNADATITFDRSTLDDIALGKLRLTDLADSGKVKFEGDRAGFKALLGLFDKFDYWFAITTP
ncbi:MBL fold metallo-hydrolase [Paraburkholderia sp. Tr-20389]|uniref:alkyl/aryl-sulfatase n=1 Tax=Paraburkholderia sp. Tr-20389 TaxID=2703903 RepID=UPI001980BD17|nr:alkyl sulfatase dimerization domain-containing protein [Paraburkholderia sp. Tr-20389]MBN3757951.1 MBL fold metallo-hydrolase [Paraburkholderia sp. Tr-20389]